MDINRIHEILETLVEGAKNEFDKGIECVDLCEMAQVTDMIKDLSQALYHRVVTETMRSGDDDVESADRVRKFHALATEISDDLSELTFDISSDEKTLLKQKLQNIIQKLQ